MAQAGENNPDKKKGNLKLILTVTLVVIVAVGVSVAATLFFLGDQLASTEPEEAAEEQASEDARPETFYYRFEDPFVVSLGGDRRERYMQIHLAVAMQDEDVSEDIEEHGPTLRSRVRTLLARQDFGDIQSREAKEALQKELTELINEVLEEEGVAAIDTVLYRNFVAQ